MSQTGPRALAGSQGLLAPSLPLPAPELPDTLSLPRTATSPVPAQFLRSPAPFPSLLKSIKSRTLFRGWLRCRLLWEAASCPTSEQKPLCWCLSLSRTAQQCSSRVGDCPSGPRALSKHGGCPFHLRRWARSQSKQPTGLLFSHPPNSGRPAIPAT